MTVFKGLYFDQTSGFSADGARTTPCIEKENGKRTEKKRKYLVLRRVLRGLCLKALDVEPSGCRSFKF